MNETRRYPLSENAAESVRAKSGRALSEITLEALERGDLVLDDISIAPETLHLQAAIARECRHETMAHAFDRAAEMVAIPHDVLLECYEILRPGRARRPDDIHALSKRIREDFGAVRTADFMDEAAEAYVRRGMFVFRY